MTLFILVTGLATANSKYYDSPIKKYTHAHETIIKCLHIVCSANKIKCIDKHKSENHMITSTHINKIIYRFVCKRTYDNKFLIVSV